MSETQKSPTPPQDKGSRKPTEYRIGDLYWVDKGEDIRQVARCSQCSKFILVPWATNPPKRPKCRSCSD